MDPTVGAILSCHISNVQNRSDKYRVSSLLVSNSSVHHFNKFKPPELWQNIEQKKPELFARLDRPKTSKFFIALIRDVEKGSVCQSVMNEPRSRIEERYIKTYHLIEERAK